MPEITDVALIPVKGSKTEWIVAQDYIYEYNGRIYTVPKGFKTDLASTPRMLWLTFPPFRRYTGASVIHDFLYSCGYKIGITRKEADLIFLGIMEELGVPAWKRKTMYRAVRLFGASHYRKGA